MPRLQRRLSQLEAKHQTQVAARYSLWLVVYPDTWPAEDRAALDGTDDAARRTAIARQTGQVPGPTTTVVVIAEGRDESSSARDP